MKKVMLMLLSALLALSAVGCVSLPPQEDLSPSPTAAPTQTPQATEPAGTQPPASVEPEPTQTPPEEGSLEALLAGIYANVQSDEAYKAWLSTGLVTTEITEANAEYYLGTNELEFERAIASEPMISAQAYSLCLIKMDEDADMEAAKAAIRENVNPAKWICVVVDEKDVIVDDAGGVIILIMADKSAELHEAFKGITGITAE
ncbi:MAG: hypothetical protein ACOX8S_10675 [Christensenellales bacterium]